MWGNCINLVNMVNLNTPYDDVPFESTASDSEKKICDKQIKIENELCIDSDTDFQSFILPLEQDFTKSSKGYASLTATSDKEIKFIDYKNKLDRSEESILLGENLSDSDYVKNTGEKLLHNNSSYSFGRNNTNNTDNLCNEKNAKLIHDDTLENIKDNQTGENMFSKIHNSSQISHNVNHISKTEENILHLEKCIKTTHEFSINIFTSGRFSDKSDDSSELSETGSFYNGCDNSISFDDDSSSNNSIIFSEDEKIKNWFSSIEIDKTFNTSIYSESSDDDCLKESKERTTSVFSEDFTFEFGSVKLLKNPISSQENLYEPITALSSEGYINESFEDDDFLFEKSSFIKDINDSWNDSMKNISGDPHESKRVLNYKQNLILYFLMHPTCCISVLLKFN